MKKFIQLQFLLILISFIFSCNHKINKESQQIPLAQEIITGEIIRGVKDTTHLTLLINNNTTERIQVPPSLGTYLNPITFTTPSGQPSKFGDGGGGSACNPKALLPGESYFYEIGNYEHFLLKLSSNIEQDQVGWFTLHWTMEYLDIKESISIYYDREEVIKNLDN